MRDHHPDVRVLTIYPLNGMNEQQYKAANLLVAEGIDCVCCDLRQASPSQPSETDASELRT